MNSAPLGYKDLESATLSTAPARHIEMTTSHFFLFDFYFSTPSTYNDIVICKDSTDYLPLHYN